jgi:hypothetical protein
MTRTPRKTQIRYTHMDRYAAEPKQVFHALTQVCRQLRTEFHPLYIMRNTVLIRHYHLEMYLGFLNKHKTDDSLGGQHANFVGNIAVAMHPHPDDFYNSPGRTTDLFPILAVCQSSPHLRIRCGANGYGPLMNGVGLNAKVIERPLNALFDIRNNPKLRDYLDKAVVRLELSSPPCLRLWIRKQHWRS